MDVLLDLRVAAFAAADKLPGRILVLPWGDNKTASGRKAIVGPKTLSVLPAMQKSLGFEEVALDYEHNTVRGTRAYQDSEEPRAVAAYGALSVVEGEGVVFIPSRWTPSGQKKAFEFQDLSPAPATDENGEVIFMHSVALCRNGDVEDLRFVTLSVGSGEATHQEEKTMGTELTELNGRIDTLQHAVDALRADLAPATAAAAKIETLSADLAAMKAAEVKRQRDTIVAGAATAGKVIPLTAEQIEAMDVQALSTMVGKLPVTVPLHKRTPAVEPLSATGGNPTLAQYNAIRDPDERAAFYRANRDKILGRG